MSVELQDDEFDDIEVTLTGGGLRIGPNMHPANIIRWVVACYESPERVMTGDNGQKYTGADIVARYFRTGEVDGTSHSQLYAAVQARWGGVVKSTLHPGDCSPRYVYRWMRRQARLWTGDIALEVRWAQGESREQVWWTETGLPEGVCQLLHRLDLHCKTWDLSTCRWSGRLREWVRRSQRRELCAYPRRRDGLWESWRRPPGDRHYGLAYARMVSALLRAAHREGVALTVRVA